MGLSADGLAVRGNAGIDKSTAIPLYFQIKQLIRSEITSSRWPPGTKLPTETELCIMYDLSRSTVRQALAELEREGLITRQRGRGSFVRATRSTSWLLQANGFFQDEARRAGVAVTSTVINAGIAALPAWACDALEVPPRSDGVRVERLRSIDGQVALYVVNHTPERFASAVLSGDLERESLYERLQEVAGVRVGGGTRRVEATAAEDRLAELLEVRAGSPLVFIESVAWDAERMPFDCYRAWLRTDRVHIEINADAAGTESSMVRPAEQVATAD